MTFHSKEYYLLYNGAALFAVQDHFDGKDLADIGQVDTREGFAELAALIAILSEQGELARRYMGHEAGEILSAEAVLTLANFADMVYLRHAVMQALLAGHQREIEGEEIDLGLIELQKKEPPVGSGQTIRKSLQRDVDGFARVYALVLGGKTRKYFVYLRRFANNAIKRKDSKGATGLCKGLPIIKLAH